MYDQKLQPEPLEDKINDKPIILEEYLFRDTLH